MAARSGSRERQSLVSSEAQSPSQSRKAEELLNGPCGLRDAPALRGHLRQHRPQQALHLRQDQQDGRQGSAQAHVDCREGRRLLVASWPGESGGPEAMSRAAHRQAAGFWVVGDAAQVHHLRAEGGAQQPGHHHARDRHGHVGPDGGRRGHRERRGDRARQAGQPLRLGADAPAFQGQRRAKDSQAGAHEDARRNQRQGSCNGQPPRVQRKREGHHSRGQRRKQQVPRPPTTRMNVALHDPGVPHPTGRSHRDRQRRHGRHGHEQRMDPCLDAGRHQKPTHVAGKRPQTQRDRLRDPPRLQPAKLQEQHARGGRQERAGRQPRVQVPIERSLRRRSRRWRQHRHLFAASPQSLQARRQCRGMRGAHQCRDEAARDQTQEREHGVAVRAGRERQNDEGRCEKHRQPLRQQLRPRRERRERLVRGTWQQCSAGHQRGREGEHGEERGREEKCDAARLLQKQRRSGAAWQLLSKQSSLRPVRGRLDRHGRKWAPASGGLGQLQVAAMTPLRAKSRSRCPGDTQHCEQQSHDAGAILQLRCLHRRIRRRNFTAVQLSPELN
eukprot:scaffold831_cov268-Pinguiococcus_pyrenoidosus.AAC.11